MHSADGRWTSSSQSTLRCSHRTGSTRMAQPTGVLFLLVVSAVTLASGRVLRDTFAGEKFTCGLRPVEPSSIGERLANGHTPKYGSYPWQARLDIYFGDEGPDGCGGTIIDDNWVLSAAHCFIFEDEPEKPWTSVDVFVGEHRTDQMDPSEQHFGIERLFMHENYDSDTDDNDIALLKLRPNNGKVIQFDDNVQPACLPAPDTPYTAGKTCLISGWGDTNPVGDETIELQAAEVTLWNDSHCLETLRKYDSDRILTSNMVCAGPVDVNGGTCGGDSGGPVVSKEEAGYTVLGIVSWSEELFCGGRNEPQVYTKVNQFLPWIQEKMQA